VEYQENFTILVKSYLDGRYQKVILSHNNGIESTWEKIKQGVPQGSILGPIFFLIYMNDLPNLASIGTKILLYADSTSIIVTSPNLENFETKIDKNFGFDHWWLSIMEGSYRPNDVPLEYNTFCNSNDTSYNVCRNFKNGLFCIHTFHYELWDNFLEKSTI